MSASTPTFVFSVPAGHSPPFFVVTDTDHTAWIIIAASLGLVSTLVFGGIRAIVRRSVSPGLGLDDAFITVSTILTIIQSAIVLAGCSYGFGKSVELVPLSDQDKVQKFYYVGNQLFLIALGLSKLSVIFLLLRLAIATHHRRLLYLAAVFTTVWMCASFLAVTLQCNLAHPWIILGQRCSGTFLRWKIISAFDIITEISTIGICAQIVWNLQCPVSTKATVVGAFSFRLLIIISIALRLSTFDETHQISNFSLVESLFVVWTQTELNYSLISATIPTLRRFALSLNTRFGGLQEVESEYSRGNSADYGHGMLVDASSEGKSFVSSDKSRVLEGRTITEHAPDFTKEPIMRTSDTRGQTTRIATGSGSTGKFSSRTGQIKGHRTNWESTSIGSNESQHMIIKRDVRFGQEDLVIQQASLRPQVQY